jgi:hypothetical protein
MIFIMACGESKNPGKLPAFRKYAGRQFAVLAEELSGLWAAGHTVYILSAKHGLIPAQQTLADYDQLMTEGRGRELFDNIVRVLDDSDNAEDEIVVYGGKVYRALVAAAAGDREVIELVGEDRGCGDHFSELRAYLRSYTEDA